MDPNLQKQIDVTEIKNSMPSKPGLTPTIIIQSQPGPGGGNPDQEKFLKRIIKTEILLNALLVLILVVSLYVGFVLRFDIQKYFDKNSATVAQPETTGDKTTNGKTSDINLGFRVVEAAEKQPSPEEDSPNIYITQHGVNLDQVFMAAPSGKLTIYGQFKNEIMGFLPYWAIPRIDQINTQILTSISYFGLEVDGNGEIIKYDTNRQPIDAWVYLQKDKGLKSLFQKSQNNKLKIYLTLKCFNQDNIIRLTTSEKSREKFISSALYLMNSQALDGLNIDFEYIGTPSKQVRDGFSALIINLNKAMKAEYPHSVLTIDTFVDAASATRIHDVPVLAENSDGLVIMGYDFHTPASSVPGPVAPMEGQGLSIKGLMASYLDKAPAGKLILAVPYYGYDWPVKQVGSGFEVSGTRQEVKIVPYGEIMAATRDTKILWDENAQVPWYIYQDSQTKQSRVVYFENVRSLSTKYEFAKQKRLGGVAIWALGFDGTQTELGQTLIDKFAE